MAADDDPDAKHSLSAGDFAHLLETQIDSQRVFAGSLLDVRRDRVRLPDGREATREYLVHPGAVLIVPQLDDGRFVVERQFRYPNRAVFTEFPAGKIDAGEGPLQTARRELEEETGYTAVTWTRLGRIHSVVSYSTEAIEIYLAQKLVHVGAKLDAGEFLDVQTVQYEDLVAAAARGEITDAKTVATLFHLERRRRPGATRACSVVVAGRVQGVGFREGMLRACLGANVSGWVRNRQDGTVEALLQGAASSVDTVIAWVGHGPSAARIALVEVNPRVEDSSPRSFEVRATA